MQENTLSPNHVSMDRVTLRLDAVFQSTDTQTIVPVSCSFDRVKECGDSAVANTTRLSPGKLITLPGIQGGDSTLFRWVIIHNLLRFTEFSMMVEAKANNVRILDKDGNLISVLPSNEMTTIVHPGPLRAESESASCSLQTTVFPY